MTQATKHHGAELELDPMRHAEPMKFVAENVSQSAVVLPCFGDDTSRGVEHPLQLVCSGFWRLGVNKIQTSCFRLNAFRLKKLNKRNFNNIGLVLDMISKQKTC